MISCIVAVDNNWAIGKKGGLLFKLPKDMRRFKEITLDSVVVMGENTFLSLPKQQPLKNRVNIILCQEGHNYDFENCFCTHTFEETLKLAKCFEKVSEVYVIGGGMMYESMLPYCGEILVTKVDYADKDATVFFPNLAKMPEFRLIEISDPVIDNEYSTRYLRYLKYQKYSITL